MCVSADPAVHIAHLTAFANLGAETLDIHAVAGDQQRFIDMYGSEVLPALRG